MFFWGNAPNQKQQLLFYLVYGGVRDLGNLEIAKNSLCFAIDNGALLPEFRSCLLKDIDVIFKIFSISLNDSSGFVGARLSKINKIFEIQNVEILRHDIF